MLRKILLLGLLPVLLSALVFAAGCSGRATPSAPATGNLEVLVVDSAGNPLAGGKVVSNTQPAGQLKVTGLTDAAGKVIFRGIAAGEYDFYINRFNYLQIDKQLIVPAGQTASVVIPLQSSDSPAPSPPVTNSP